MAHHSLRFGLLLLGYSMIEPVPFRRLEWGNLSASRFDLLKNIMTSIKVESVSEIDPTWTAFFERVAPSYECLIRRDATYVEWRYFLRPDRNYLVLAVRRRNRLAGWSVFYREGNRIVWGDALFEKRDISSVRALLAHLRAHPIAQGTRFIECWFPPRPSWWDSTLQGLGFEAVEEPDKLHFCIGILGDKDAPEKVRNSFYYTMGDSDLF